MRRHGEKEAWKYFVVAGSEGLQRKAAGWLSESYERVKKVENNCMYTNQNTMNCHKKRRQPELEARTRGECRQKREKRKEEERFLLMGANRLSTSTIKAEETVARAFYYNAAKREERLGTSKGGREDYNATKKSRERGGDPKVKGKTLISIQKNTGD